LRLLLDTCRGTGKTVIVVTHNSALTQMADRVIRVKSGKVVSNTVNPAPKAVEDIEW
jgi:putative ABC transport system ATP-binding protein